MRKLPTFNRLQSRALLLAGTAAFIAASPVWADVAGDADDGKVLTVKGERTPYNPKATTTATKTPTDLINVPQAVSVIGEKQISDQNIQSMSEAVRYVPGVGSSQGEGNRDTLVFRGNTASADLFVDGIRDDVQYYRDTYNIDRVEVFKGPNAMIFGRGSPGGLINRVTKVADFTDLARLNLQIGSFDKKRVTIDYGYAFDPDGSFRVTALRENSGSYRNGFSYKRTGFNPTLALKAGENTLITLGCEYYKDERTADRGIPSYATAVGGTRHPVDTDISTFFGDPLHSPTYSEVNALQAYAEHKFDNGLILRNRFRFADYDKFYQNIFPGAVNTAATTYAVTAYNNHTLRKNVFNQTDLIFTAHTGGISHTILTGVEFGRQESDNRRETGSFALPNSACLTGSTATTCIVSLASPTISVPVTFAQSATDALNTGVNSFAAAYVQDQIVFNDQWQLVAGLRYDSFKADATNLRATTPATRDLKARNDLVSPRVGLIFKPVPNASIYTSYGLTYLPRSGEQLASLSVTNQALDPEEFRNTEIGAKWDVNPSLTLTAAVYRLNRSNAAVADPLDATKLVLLSGDSQRIEGVELALTGQITPQWQVIAAYASQNARTLQSVGTLPAGRKLAQSPSNTVSVWNRYDFSPKWGAAIGVLYRDKSFATTSNAVTLDSYTRVDGGLYYAVSPNVQLQLNVENLADVKYYSVADNDNNITPGAPRSAYVTLNLKY
jgi:catecholate siderophore receptor